MKKSHKRINIPLIKTHTRRSNNGDGHRFIFVAATAADDNEAKAYHTGGMVYNALVAKLSQLFTFLVIMIIASLTVSQIHAL